MATERGFTINYDYKEANFEGEMLKPGIQFTETMKGFFSTNEKRDFERGKDRRVKWFSFRIHTYSYL